MIDLAEVSACLISKDAIYPPEIIKEISQYPFGEILILTHSDSPYRKHDLFRKANFDHVYYQDDDCIAPIGGLVNEARYGKITCAMKPGHLACYADKLHCLIGWGAIFPRDLTYSLDYYVSEYGKDDFYHREAERIMTGMNHELQVRLNLPITDLPSAMAADRLWRQPGHFEAIPIVEERCAKLLEKLGHG